MIIIAIFAALAIAVGAIIVSKVTAKANSIPTEHAVIRPRRHGPSAATRPSRSSSPPPLLLC